MVREKNIIQLTELLARLGLTGIEQDIRLPIYFGVDQFVIKHAEEKNGDHLHCVLYFVREEQGSYQCQHYDATLRTKIVIHEDAAELDKKMKAIAWKEV